MISKIASHFREGPSSTGDIGPGPFSALRQIVDRLARGGAHKQLHYRPDIDGLRAIAVLSVVFFHLGLQKFPGGFVGVDVFFVISGYLIMLTIAEDLHRERFSLRRFYERRIRRIFPALFFMSLFCILVSLVLSTPSEMKQFGENLIAMALFVSNIFLRYAGARGGYFGDDSKSNLLLHTWSLSVEEQFYILLPPLVAWLVWRKRQVLPWLLTLCVMSFLLSVVWTKLNQKESFYFVVTRAWEFLIGSALAVMPARSSLSRGPREATALCGLLLIGVAVFGYSEATMFPGLAALPPCLGALLIIYAGEQGDSLVGAILSSKPFVFIGALSYSLYLWHWPVIIFAKRLTLNELGDMNATTVTAIFVVSLALAYFSYLCVERPFRRYKVFFNQRRLFYLGGAASLATIALGIVFVASDGLASRYPAGTHSIISDNLARLEDFPPDNKCSNWQNEARRLGDIYTCPLGAEGAKKILFWGDSHVDTIRPLIKDLYEKGAFDGRGVLFFITNGCPPMTGLRPIDEDYPHCNAFTSQVMPRAMEDDVDTVFIGFAGGWWDVSLCLSHRDVCEQTPSEADRHAHFLAELKADFATLKSAGKKVVLELPWPSYTGSPPKYEINQFRFRNWNEGSKSVLDGLELLKSIKRADHLAFRKELLALAKAYGVTIFDPRAALCPEGRCIYQRDHVSIYSDNDHIATSQLGIFAKDLQAAIQRTQAPGPK